MVLQKQILFFTDYKSCNADQKNNSNTVFTGKKSFFFVDEFETFFSVPELFVSIHRRLLL